MPPCGATRARSRRRRPDELSTAFSCGAAVGGCSVGPPVALALDVIARRLAEIGRADDEDLEALRPRLVASPRTGRDAHHVPILELDDLVVELHAPAPAH